MIDKRELLEKTRALRLSLQIVEKESLIKFSLKSQFSNPLYLQLKIGYDAAIGKNWIKIDVTKESVLDYIEKKQLKKLYSDHPEFSVNVESIEEIFSEKIRSLIERTKCRDYFDVLKLCSMDFDKGKVLKLFRKKCEIKGIRFSGVEQIFPDDIESVLSPYWNQELGRLLNPLPDLNSVLADLRAMLKFLES